MGTLSAPAVACISSSQVRNVHHFDLAIRLGTRGRPEWRTDTSGGSSEKCGRAITWAIYSGPCSTLLALHPLTLPPCSLAQHRRITVATADWLHRHVQYVGRLAAPFTITFNDLDPRGVSHQRTRGVVRSQPWQRSSPIKCGGRAADMTRKRHPQLSFTAFDSRSDDVGVSRRSPTQVMHFSEPPLERAISPRFMCVHGPHLIKARLSDEIPVLIS